MWNRSMLRANRKIPERIPASAIATKEERGEPGQASVESAAGAAGERPSYAQDSLGEMLAESSIL